MSHGPELQGRAQLQGCGVDSVSGKDGSLLCGVCVLTGVGGENTPAE